MLQAESRFYNLVENRVWVGMGGSQLIASHVATVRIIVLEVLKRLRWLLNSIIIFLIFCNVVGRGFT